MVLETPTDRKNSEGKNVEDKGVWATEIKMLESLVGMDTDSDGFRKLERELQAEGKVERDRIQGQVDQRGSKKSAKGVKKKKSTTSDDESE
jgi:AP endonuclease-1